MIVSPFGPSALTILARICAQVMPSTLRANLPISSRRERLAGCRRPGSEPVSQSMRPGLQVRRRSCRRSSEAELGGLDQVADERQRVLQDALERRAGLLDVGHQRPG